MGYDPGLRGWHNWFAWFPVLATSERRGSNEPGTVKLVWLRSVQRKLDIVLPEDRISMDDGCMYDYRLVH